MQVHAVPEAERAFDASGRRLPWGYEYADPEMNQRRAPEEKGPFGKATRRRGMSRSKTMTPARKEDLAQLENARAMDDVFNSFKAQLRTQQPDTRVPIQSASTGALPNSRAPDNLNAQALATSLPASSVVTQPSGEPTQIILYGFGTETQYAAIEFYERVSGGIVYEDYDRHPPNSRYNLSLSMRAASLRGSISQTALRMRNSYQGGDHWIKVTFDSREAAERACEASPHLICGHAVHAEPYRGIPPPADEAIRATGEVIASLNASPTGTTGSSSTLANSNTQSSTTLTSGTVIGSPPPAGVNLSFNRPSIPQTPPPARAPVPAQGPLSPTADTAATSGLPATTPLRIRGAKRAVLRPAEEALLPVPAWWKTLLFSLPLIGWILCSVLDEAGRGQNQGVIGDALPRKDDGSFDWEKAGYYWTFWAWLDWKFGTDYCGLTLVGEE